jgi:hypothetical protein
MVFRKMVLTLASGIGPLTIRGGRLTRLSAGALDKGASPGPSPTVYEQCPFILLDSVEAPDANRRADLVEYVAEYSDYLVVALLAEDAAALSDDYEYVQTI